MLKPLVLLSGVALLLTILFASFVEGTSARSGAVLDGRNPSSALHEASEALAQMGASVVFPHPMLSELKVRQAIAHCTDRRALAEAAYPTLTPSEIDALLVDSFLPSTHWAYSQPSTQYPFNQNLGRTLLEQAGWTQPSGEPYRVNAQGDPLILKLSSTEVDYRLNWAQAFEQQMVDCGIWIIRLHASGTWLFGEKSGIDLRDFELGGYRWPADENPYVDERFACDRIPSAENDWQGLNVTGWCNATASAAAEIAANTLLTDSQRLPYFATLQEEFAKDLPSLPLFRLDSGQNVETIDFNFAAPPPPNPALNALRVRQAVAHCTDRRALAEAVYPTLSQPEIDALMMDSFLPSTHWAYSQPSTLYPFDQSQGNMLLEQAGWTLPGGGTYRVNAQGVPLVLKLSTTGAGYRLIWAELFEQQLASCGIWVISFHLPPSWLFGVKTGINKRDFELGGYANLTDVNPDVDERFGCDQIPSGGNGWQGKNVVGWCNETASQAAKLAANTLLTDSQRLPYFATLQEEFAKDLPSLPLFHRDDGTAAEFLGFNMFRPETVYLPAIIK